MYIYTHTFIMHLSPYTKFHQVNIYGRCRRLHILPMVFTASSDATGGCLSRHGRSSEGAAVPENAGCDGLNRAKPMVFSKGTHDLGRG